MRLRSYAITLLRSYYLTGLQSQTIFPTAYMPPVIYFALLLKCDDPIVIETQETFPKQTWRNRANILSARGLLDLSIPVIKPLGNKTITLDVQIDTAQKWQNNHWRAIESAYNKSPYFLYYKDALQALIYSDETYLLDYNSALLCFFLESFKIKKDIEFTEEYIHLPEDEDLRQRLNPKKLPLLPLDQFPVYYQVFSDRFPFSPNLSILDLLVNEGPEGLSYLQELASLIDEL
jgi:hypothetical protein